MEVVLFFTLAGLAVVGLVVYYLVQSKKIGTSGPAEVETPEAKEE